MAPAGLGVKHSVKLTAKVNATLDKRTVDALEPEDKSWIAWHDKLTAIAPFPNVAERRERPNCAPFPPVRAYSVMRLSPLRA